MIKITHSGNFNNTERFFSNVKDKNFISLLDEYGRRGVDALSSNTPIDSGKTAYSWGYEIHMTKNSWKIIWTNDNINRGIPIAILIQYGHATKNGGYVEGRDFINPAMQPIFDKMADELWREVTES